MILGLGGYAESGKDAFADAMIQHDPRWSKTYMSYSLEQALLVLDPYVPIFIEDDYKRFPNVYGAEGWEQYSHLHERVGYGPSKMNPEVRRLLQMLGTQVGRNMFGDNVWVDKMLEIASQNEFTIVTGIRYRNEIDAIIANQGITAWVSRPGVGPINSHTSDNSLGPEDFEIEIVNNSTLEKLAEMAEEFSDAVFNQAK